MTTIDQADYYSEGSCTNNDLGEPNSYIKRAGPFILGPKLGNSPVKCISHCLARKDGTNSYFTIKILNKKQPSEAETIDDQQGKVLIHTEYSLLTALQGEPGVVQQHGLFKDVAMEEVENKDGEILPTGNMQTRLCLVLDCYTPHDFCPEYTQLTNLQYYVIKEKRLSEFEAIDIFYKTVQIVERLHKRNIVHRDLKLGNIILNRETREVKLTNFCLGKQLSSENDYLKDQRGSPAYISPDVISGKPYLGKPSDMWALGVVLYTMLCGQFPFYDKSPTELFKKIKSAEFHVPIEHNISQNTVELIQSLLVLNPAERLTASQALSKLRRIMCNVQAMKPIEFTQVVPDFPGHSQSRKRTYDTMIEYNSAYTLPIATPVITEPKIAKVEEAEVDGDDVNNVAPDYQYQEYEYESKDQVGKEEAEVEIEQPVTKNITTFTELMKHLKAVGVGIGESSIRSLFETEYGKHPNQSGSGMNGTKMERYQHAGPPAARHGVQVTRKLKRQRSLSKSRIAARVPSPSIGGFSDEYGAQSPDSCDIDDELEPSGKATAADAFASAAQLPSATAN